MWVISSKYPDTIFNIKINNMIKELIAEAIKTYGAIVVADVMEMIELSDADGLFSMYEDVGLYEHAEVVSLLYFNNN